MVGVLLIFALILAQKMNFFGNRRSCEIIMIIILLMIIAEDLKIFGDHMIKKFFICLPICLFVEVSHFHKSGD